MNRKLLTNFSPEIKYPKIGWKKSKWDLESQSQCHDSRSIQEWHQGKFADIIPLEKDKKIIK